MRLLKLPTKAAIGVGLFVLALLLFFALSGRGDASELDLEVGSAMLRGETPALGLHVRWPRQGPVNTDWEAGLLLSGSSTHRQDNGNAATWYGMLVDGYKRVELGLGWAWTNAPWEYTCQSTFALMARYRATDRIALQWRHFSSAGSCKPNAGRDFLTAAWRF